MWNYHSGVHLPVSVTDRPQAIECCDKVLKTEPTNAKALFRRATANLDRNEWDLALKVGQNRQ